MKKAILVLEDSAVIRGSGFGAVDVVYGYPVYHNTCQLLGSDRSSGQNC